MKQNSRAALLDAGLQTLLQSGYHGATVRNIVSAASAAQGSFTNHFRSKEVFTSEVLALYFEHVQALMAEAMQDSSLSPRQRIMRYLDSIADRLAADNFQRGCLIGDLSAEAPGSSELIRQQLKSLYGTWRQPFADCIAELQQQGEISNDFSPEQLADFLLSSWEGAILRAKVEQSAEPLLVAKEIIMHTILKSKEYNHGK